MSEWTQTYKLTNIKYILKPLQCEVYRFPELLTDISPDSLKQNPDYLGLMTSHSLPSSIP